MWRCEHQTCRRGIGDALPPTTSITTMSAAKTHGGESPPRRPNIPPPSQRPLVPGGYGADSFMMQHAKRVPKFSAPKPPERPAATGAMTPKNEGPGGFMVSHVRSLSPPPGQKAEEKPLGFGADAYMLTHLTSTREPRTVGPAERHRLVYYETGAPRSPHATADTSAISPKKPDYASWGHTRAETASSAPFSTSPSKAPRSSTFTLDKVESVAASEEKATASLLRLQLLRLRLQQRPSCLKKARRRTHWRQTRRRRRVGWIARWRPRRQHSKPHWRHWRG